MRLVKRRYEDVVILEMRGTFDGNVVPVLRERVDGMIADGDVKIVLDGAGLDFLSSEAMGYLVRLSRQTKDHDGELVLARPSEFLKRTLVTLKLERLFPIFDDLEKALLHLVRGAEVSTMDLSGVDRDDSLLQNAPVVFRVLGRGKVPAPDAVGRIVNLREDSLLVRLGPVPDAELDGLNLASGAQVQLTFRQPFVIKDYTFELEGEVQQVSRLEKDGVDHGTSFRVAYGKVKDEDRTRLNQFVRDQALWRVEREI